MLILQVDIINVGSGNTRSLKTWFELNNIHANLVSEPKDIFSETLVLPGVGAAGNFMNQLKMKNLDKAILEHLQKNGRLLGICLGFQVLFESTEEDGGVETLGILNGHVSKLTGSSSNTGWQSLNFDLRRTKISPLWRQFKLNKKQIFSGRVFYNHQYGVVHNLTSDLEVKISDELDAYSALTVSGGIIGMQFHPEKSQRYGLDLLKLFL